MTLTRFFDIRTDEQTRNLWILWAAERNLTVSDLVREAVEAYCTGYTGVAFLASCRNAERHTPGLPCPACGGRVAA